MFECNRGKMVPAEFPTEDLCPRGQPSGFSVATLRLSLLFAELLGAAKVAAPCGEGGRSNFHRANIGAAREFRSIRGRTECCAKGPIVRIAWARMFDSFANLGCGGPVQFN